MPRRSLNETSLRTTLCGRQIKPEFSSARNLSDDLGEKLVNHSINRLRKKPHLHDKYEFEVALNCIDFNFESIKTRLIADGFNNSECDEIRKQYLKLTNRIVKEIDYPIDSLLNCSKTLEANRLEITSQNPESVPEILQAIRGFLVIAKPSERFRSPSSHATLSWLALSFVALSTGERQARRKLTLFYPPFQPLQENSRRI